MLIHTLAAFYLTSLARLAHSKDVDSTRVSGRECPGVIKFTGSGSDDGYCCVGGDLTLSNCPGWPICTGPTTIDPRSTTLSCATTVPLSAADYSSLVSSASDSYYRTKGSGSADATSTPRPASGVHGGSATATPTRGGGGRSGSTATASTNGVGKAVATVFPAAVGIAVVAALGYS